MQDHDTGAWDTRPLDVLCAKIALGAPVAGVVGEGVCKNVAFSERIALKPLKPAVEMSSTSSKPSNSCLGLEPSAGAGSEGEGAEGVGRRKRQLPASFLGPPSGASDTSVSTTVSSRSGDGAGVSNSRPTQRGRQLPASFTGPNPRDSTPPENSGGAPSSSDLPIMDFRSQVSCSCK